MIVTYIRWRDACSKEAADSPAPTPELCELTEVGFLLAETDDAVLIGMEQSVDGTEPGRWRLNIPKTNILERKDVELRKAFPGLVASKKKNPKKTAAVYLID